MNQNAILSEIVRPAATLAAKIQTSPADYEFRNSVVRKYSGKREVMRFKADAFKKYKMIDIKTRRPMKPNSVVFPDRGGFVGTTILPLDPGLFCIEANRKFVLRQPVWLVSLYEPSASRVSE